MEKQAYNLSQRQTIGFYGFFTILGLFMLLAFRDVGTAGVSLSLALMFNPFVPKSYGEFTPLQKVVTVGQMVLAVALIGVAFAQEILG